MRRHLRTNAGTIVVSILIFTVLPLAVERWHLIREQRVGVETINEMTYGDLSKFFRIDEGLSATDASKAKGLLSTTEFTRYAWRDISASQVLSLTCIYDGGRRINLAERDPINLKIDQGLRTVNVAYSLHDFGIDELSQKGVSPEGCSFYWTKQWTLQLASGVDRIIELKSNRFRIID
jgi:hypothetical protein